MLIGPLVSTRFIHSAKKTREYSIQLWLDFPLTLSSSGNRENILLCIIILEDTINDLPVLLGLVVVLNCVNGNNDLPNFKHSRVQTKQIFK